MEPNLDDLIDEIAQLRQTLLKRANGSQALDACVRILARLASSLADRPRVVLLGEPNVGKTTLGNALLAEEVLPDSVLANTRRPSIVRYASTAKIIGVTATGRHTLTHSGFSLTPSLGLRALEIEIPNPRLEQFDLVDTPGLVDVDQLRAWRLGARDLLLWCTLATQAWKDSERRLWERVPPQCRQDAIIVATHRDGLGDEAMAASVRDRLVAATSGSARSVVLVTARNDPFDVEPDDQRAQGLEELETRIAESLAVIAARRRAKAVRIANRVVAKAIAILEARQK